ncbi:coiled-coil domain-containing protein-domain-containing protein [Microdochium trichocladiopsis]|uniref:Coiled-coil domain-containing protein-domain-containing protein n=1 Tax=Microdochium trichocladiopsis TaxID=1682393 RepID=A0A9P8Y788_9PEZI|nr:coiled-coil domain-containing protein-domain-containing protein [Microdochium trichocladiopsis]KAH7029436.1 coiled-coil domain-containing protein-domain-containing protein [Microdochium trichocladiopsis]
MQASQGRPPSPVFSQPRPRVPRSPAQSAQVRVRNRRREYLERNPSYFESLEHELADPLLYDSLIRRFQSPADREKEGRKKGYSRVLEVDLLRGEAKLTRARATNSRREPSGTHVGGAVEAPTVATMGDRLAPPETLDEGRERWRDFLRRRFVLGRDEDFEYRAVDENDDLDTLERRDAVEAWFDDEEPGWASDQLEDDGADDTEMKGARAKPLEGETGIQDF